MRQRGKIVRPIDLPRLSAATVGVSRKMGEVLNQAGAQWEPRLLANLYAAAALEADDAHGEEHGLISQDYGISRTDPWLSGSRRRRRRGGGHRRLPVLAVISAGTALLVPR